MKHFGSSITLAMATVLAFATPALAHNTPAEVANKQVVLDFYKALRASEVAGTRKTQIQGIMEKYLSPDYTQHAEAFSNLPGTGTARDKLIRMFQSRPAGPVRPEAKTLAIMAEGDLVMMFTARDGANPAAGGVKPGYVFNMFRVKNGQLVEHWDIGTAELVKAAPPVVAPLPQGASPAP